MIIAAVLLAAGGLHALAFAPTVFPAALLPAIQLIGLAVLAALVWRADSPRQAAWRGFAFGIGSFGVGMYWVFISLHVYGHMAVWLAAVAVVLLAALLAVFYAAGCGLAWRLGWAAPGRAASGRAASGRAAPPWLSLPIWSAAWAGAEWLRGMAFTGMPWLNAGYGHVDGGLAGYAPVLGVYGVAFFAALVAGALAMVVLASGLRSRLRAVAMAVIVLVVGGGLQQLDWGISAAGAPLSVRLVQGNVDQSNKFDPALILAALERHLALAASPPQEPGFKPDLIVLPETAIPLFQDQLPEPLWQAWVDLAAGWNATVATGIPLHTAGPDGASEFTNSVIGITPDVAPVELINGRAPWRYDKSHLVPFGEFVPTGFRWFVDAMVMPLGDFHRGADRQPSFAVGNQYVAFNVCYEDVFGEELLPALHAGADGSPGATILGNVTNLGWFGDSWALPQHLQIARMRSIETGRPTLRATNTGVTAVIDERGQVQASLTTLAQGVLDTTVQGTTGLTPYARGGNVPVLLLLALLLAAGGWFQRRKS